MGKYRIETSQGTFVINASRQPTQEEAMQAISQRKHSVGGTAVARAGEHFTNVFERPGAASRAVIKKQPLTALLSPALAGGIAQTGLFGQDLKDTANQAFDDPSSISTFEQDFSKGAMKIGGSDNVPVNWTKGMVGSIFGLVADSLTSPADMAIDGMTAIGSKAVKALRSLGKTEDMLKAQKVASAVDTNFAKAVRPSVRSAKSGKLALKQKNNARLAVDTITDNKVNLKYVDGSSGRLPENLPDLQQAITQTKDDIFKQYSQLQSQVPDSKSLVWVDDLADDMRNFKASNPVKDFSPQTIKKADEFANTLGERGFYTLEEADELVKNLNNELKSFYINPSPQMTGEVALKAKLASRLRDKVDNIITSETGSSYSLLKKRYGALRAIENDVANRVVVDARKNKLGFFDLPNVFTYEQIAEGIIMRNPLATARGVTGALITQGIKRINDPNRMIKSMFSKVDRIKSGVTAIEKAGGQLIKRSPATTRMIRSNRDIPVGR